MGDNGGAAAFEEAASRVLAVLDPSDMISDSESLGTSVRSSGGWVRWKTRPWYNAL